MDARIRVVLADDHTMFRQGLKEMLATDDSIKVVGEAVQVCREVEPDVVILDVEMPVMGAREAIGEILEITPRPKVLIVTMFDSPHLVRELLARGASAYLVKNASMDELLTAVHAIVQSPTSDNIVPRDILAHAEEGPEGEPSARELEVLLFAARGLSNRQISVALNLSESTVKRHLANLYPQDQCQLAWRGHPKSPLGGLDHSPGRNPRGGVTFAEPRPFRSPHLC